MSLDPLRLGFVPLLDMAPLAVAREMGFAAEEGIALELTRASSWSMLRDMLVFGQVEAAQMLAPVPIAMAMGLGGAAARLDILQVLSVNGDVIGLSQRLAARMRAAGYGFDFHDARAARAALIQAADGPPRIGIPFPFSPHPELVSYLLAGAALDHELITSPPPPLVEALAADGDGLPSRVSTPEASGTLFKTAATRATSA